MTRRSRERRAAAGDGGQAVAAPPHYDAYEERRLAEEVLYLHSLWRSGPLARAPASAPAPPAGVSRDTRASAGGSRATRARPNQRKRRRIERHAAEPEEPDADWPLAPSPPASPSPASWPDAAPSSPAPRPQPQQQPSPASLAQRDALRAAQEFFSGRGSSAEDGDESEGSEPEDGGDAAEGFFLGLFERDAALRGYYERSHEEGEFRCMGCVGRKGKSQARRFRDCVSLVHHARDARRCGRPLAHRALAAVVCRVLGWDVTRLPSIVIDPRGTLGQALLAREGASAAAATAQEAKDNVDAGESGRKDAAKEDVGLEKNGSLTDDKKEDVDSAMNEGPLSDGDAAKEDVDSIMSDGPLSDGDAAKEDVDSIMSDGPLSDGDAAKEDVDKGKIGAPSNNNRGEVHEQGNGTETAEKEYDVVKALAPAPAGGSRASTNRRKRRKIECSAEPEEGPDWPLAPSLPAPTSPSSRPDATLSSPTPRQQGREPSPALLAQQDALHAAKAFFSGRGTSGEEDDGVNEAAGFFLGLFERDATLRGYYERSHKEGEFLCMGCVGMSVKRGGSRRFRDCASLVQHARAVTRCGRPQAHRALAGVVCRVLGWNIKRLPNIVIDPRGTLGQALLVREGEGTAAATAQEAKENVNIVDNDGTDAVKEDTNDIHPLSSKDTNDMDPLNSKDTPKELCKAVQEEGAICKKQEYAKSADDMGDTCNVRLENNSSKEKAATENKEEHTDGVVDSGDDIGNLGNNLTDSSKS